MKRILLIAAALFASLAATAQNAQQLTTEAMERSDVLWLDENLARLRDSLPEPLYLMAEALRGAGLNDYNKSNRAIEQLLNQHGKTIGNGAIGQFYGLLINNLNAQGHYATAAKLLENSSEKGSYNHLYFKALAAVKPMHIKRPRRATKVAFTRSRLTHGAHIHIPVRIGGRTESFIFDTGAAKYNLVTESCAKRLNFRPVIDSLPTIGVGGSGVTRVATIGKMTIGNITIHNPLFIVVSDDSTPKDDAGEFRLEFVLGTDVMEALGEVQFDMESDSMTIPTALTPHPAEYAPMVHRNNGLYYIYVGIDGLKLEMQFDTGAVNTALYGQYFALHEERIKAAGTKEVARARGFGGTTHFDAYTLPQTTITIGRANALLTGLKVATDDQHLPIQSNEFGSLGVDALLGLRRVTINFRSMFVSAEQ